MDPRGKLPDLPPDFGDPTPDRDQEPIDAGDAGRHPDEVVNELREDLKQTDRAKEFDRQAREDGFRSLADLDKPPDFGGLVWSSDGWLNQDGSLHVFE